MLSIINININYKCNDVIKRLRCAYVRPHLEYCSQACHSHLKKDMKTLERVQRKAAMMVRGMGKCLKV